MPTEVEKFKEKLSILSQLVVKDDFVKAFKFLIDFTVSLKKANTETIQTLQNTFNNFINKLKEDNNKFVEDIKKKVDIKLASVKDGERGERGTDGISPDIAEVAMEASKLAQKEILPKIPTIDTIEQDLPKLGDKIRDGLELITNEDDKLSIEAIGFLRKELDELKKMRMQLGGGGGGYSKMAADLHEVFWTTIGTGDGTTDEFTLTYIPDPISSLEIKVGNADMFVDDDFTYSSSTGKITFLTDSIPANGAKIRQKCKR